MKNKIKALLFVMAIMVNGIIIIGCKEKDPEWSDKMSTEWAKSLGFTTAKSECINYHSNYAKCSVRVDNGNVYAVECLRHTNKCVGGSGR